MRELASIQALSFAAAVLALGCAVDRRELATDEPPGEATLGFELVAADGVELDTVRYDVNTPDGTDMLDGTLDVTRKGAGLSFDVEELPPGDYDLALVAVGMNAGAPSPCASDPIPFSVSAGERRVLPPVTLTCRVQDPKNRTWSVSPGADIAIETFAVDGEAVAFTYAPRSVEGHFDAAGACIYPSVVIELTAFEADLGLSIDARPDGAYALGNPSLPELTYTCASDGEKTLSITATKGADAVTKTYTVRCDSTCVSGGPVCGNGVVEQGEDCDERTPRCIDCAVHPTCGDGVVDAPEECDARVLPTDTCDVNCRTVTAG